MTPDDDTRNHDKELTTPHTWRLDIGSHINAALERPIAQLQPRLEAAAKRRL